MLTFRIIRAVISHTKHNQFYIGDGKWSKDPKNAVDYTNRDKANEQAEVLRGHTSNPVKVISVES